MNTSQEPSNRSHTAGLFHFANALRGIHDPFLSADRPDDELDPLLLQEEVYPDDIPMRSLHSSFADDIGSSGLLSIPVQQFNAVRDVQQETTPQPEQELTVDFTAEDLLEEYMEASMPTTTDLKALVPTRVERRELEDRDAHQLVVPKCPITYAVTLLRLLEDDIRTLERVRTDSVDQCLSAHAVTNWGSKLNAFVHLQHNKLVEVLRQIKSSGRVKELMTSLDRMGYTNWLDNERGTIHLRCKEHQQYGHISV